MILHCANCGKRCLACTPTRDLEMFFEWGSKIVCRTCLERYRLDSDIARMAREQAKDLEKGMPEFMKGVFK